MKTYLYTADQVRQIDQLVINEYGVPGLVLMRRAAEATIEVALARWPKLTRVAVYCGSGNNAGDGYIVAGLLANRGITVKVVSVGDVTRLGADAGAAHGAGLRRLRPPPLQRGHAVLPVVNQGDALVHIAEVVRFGDVEERVDQITEALLNDRLLDEDELI